MSTTRRPPLRAPSLCESVCIVLVFCAATAIASPAQTLTTLHSFCSQPNCADGNLPNSIVQAEDGNFYGVTFKGGTENGCPGSGGGGCGTVFKVTPDGALTTLHNFCSQPNCTDGSYPGGALVQGTDGNVYGTASSGGNAGCSNDYGCGTIFKITPGGVLTTLYRFCSQPNCTDGSNPGWIMLGADGNFYGTAAGGGNQSSQCTASGGCGTVFRLTPSGSLTTVYKFCSQPNCADGTSPMNLLQGTDDAFYGETGDFPGTVFKLTPTGTLTTLYTFCMLAYCADGATPNSLLQGFDGNLYGTTEVGGQTNYCFYNCGTLFTVTPGGMFTSLYAFCNQPDCADGFGASLSLQAPNGNFYGVAADGAIGNDSGTIFSFSPPGTVTPLYDFCSLTHCADGMGPEAMIQGSDGNLYGVTTNEGANGEGGTVFKFTGPTPPALQYVPVTECRLVDTRRGSPIQGGTWQDFIVSQLGNCGIPTTATAYSLNVTVAPHQPLRYVTAWPAGGTQPFVSLMNSLDGRIKANAAVVSAGASGAISIYATDTTDVILDIDGYFAAPGSQTLQFYPLTPCRVIDTRGADGDLGGPYLQARVERDFPVPESNCIPSGVNIAAYSMNFTVVPNPAGQQLGYLTAWPEGEEQPVVSTLNNPTATVVANAAIVAAGTGGGIAVYPSNSTDLIVDINGYFAAPGTGGNSFYPVAPCRAYDSRNNNGQPFTGAIVVPISGSPCAPPANAAGYVFNATVVPSGSLGYLTLWADPGQQPVVSTLNAYDGFITSNMAIVPNTDGSTDAYAGYGYTQLILDISGYFAP